MTGAVFNDPPGQHRADARQRFKFCGRGGVDVDETAGRSTDGTGLCGGLSRDGYPVSVVQQTRTIEPAEISLGSYPSCALDSVLHA